MPTPMYRRPAAVIPCAVLVYLSLAPAGHFLARKGLEDHEPQDQDNKPAASHKHKNEKSPGHEHAKHDLGHHQQAQAGKTESKSQQQVAGMLSDDKTHGDSIDSKASDTQQEKKN
ncbi:hypothetical protein VTO58DRAFT_105023 [Aureobasidium pullulans]|nr:hypothetical protein JADG_000046 [Aureobasidium pullulans]